MNKNRWLIWSVLISFIGLGVPAHADMVDSKREACIDKQVGDACCSTEGFSGICRQSSCGTRDPYQCLRCGKADSQSNGNSGGCNDNGGGWNSGNGGGNSGGATGAGSIAKAVGPWFLAGLFSLLLIKRRRRSKPD